MKTAIVTAKIEPEVKAAAEKAARDLGVSLSFVINQKLRSFAKNKHIELIPNAETIKAIEEAEADRTAGKSGQVAHSIKELQKQLEDL